MRTGIVFVFRSMLATLFAAISGLSQTELPSLFPMAPLSAIPPDTGLQQRQEAALRQTAARFVPFYNYTSDREVCVRIGSHADGLVARLELGRRVLPGSLAAAKGAPLAQHIAEAIPRWVGTGGEIGPWHWSRAGAPAVMQATAAIAYALHRYGQDWPQPTREAVRVAVEEATWEEHGTWFTNGGIDLVAAELLGGEALNRNALWERGVKNMEGIVAQVLAQGGPEMNAPLYTAEHLPPLVFMQSLQHDRARAQARILLEYELLVQAHLYLPGGGLGAPQSRDYSGGAKDGGDQALLPVIWVLAGDPALKKLLDEAYQFIIVAATDYAVPEVIRSIFLDKGDGYTFWTRAAIHQGSARTPHSVYRFGLDGALTNPWQAVVLPGGAASFGVAYGHRLTGIPVSSGTYVRRPAGTFAIHHQYQPCVSGDTDDTGDPMSGSGMNQDPDDFTSELYDYERLVYGRTLLTLWDPTLRGKRKGVVRTYPDTRVHLPNWAALGGEMSRAGDWRVGRMVDTYVAYYPLGDVLVEEERDGGKWFYLRLQGQSGGIEELATKSEFRSLEDYVADLKSRVVKFTTDPLAAEVDARDPVSGGHVRVRLEFRPERRFIGGVKQSVARTLDHGLMESPWASWDQKTQTLRVTRDGYAGIVYDWDDATVRFDP